MGDIGSNKKLEDVHKSTVEAWNTVTHKRKERKSEKANQSQNKKIGNGRKGPQNKE